MQGFDYLLVDYFDYLLCDDPPTDFPPPLPANE